MFNIKRKRLDHNREPPKPRARQTIRLLKPSHESVNFGLSCAESAIYLNKEPNIIRGLRTRLVGRVDQHPGESESNGVGREGFPVLPHTGLFRERSAANTCCALNSTMHVPREASSHEERGLDARRCRWVLCSRAIAGRDHNEPFFDIKTMFVHNNGVHLVQVMRSFSTTPL